MFLKRCLIYCFLARLGAKDISYARMGSKAVQKILYSSSVAHSDAKKNMYMYSFPVDPLKKKLQFYRCSFLYNGRDLQYIGYIIS